MRDPGLTKLFHPPLEQLFLCTPTMVPSSPTIARVTPHEAETLAGLARMSFRETYGGRTDPDNLRLYVDTHLTTERIRAELETPGFDFHMTRICDEPAGYLKLRRDRRPKGIPEGDCLQVERIYVLRRFQGIGIGSALMDLALRSARNAGDRAVWLQVWAQNDEAIRFYRSKGFRIYETAAFDFGNERTDDYLMRFDIPY
jgi:ribosomal protein S18 acetylase RimI-like enzyme